jgi:predicted DNA-binding transcriptional regulator YafY
VSGDLKAALLKLSASLPEARREDEERVRRRFYLDSTWWEGTDGVPHLRTLHRAVWDDRRVRLKYQPPFTLEMERVVDPYGLVAKAGRWYLVFAGNAGRVRARRMADILEVQPTGEPFERPEDFDLVAFWEGWCARRREHRTSYPVTVRVAPALLPALPHYFGEGIRGRITRAGPPDREGWVTLVVPFEGLEAARARLLGLGRAVEVLAPDALRLSLVDFAQQIVDFYGETPVSETRRAAQKGPSTD